LFLLFNILFLLFIVSIFWWRVNDLFLFLAFLFISESKDSGLEIYSLLIAIIALYRSLLSSIRLSQFLSAYLFLLPITNYWSLFFFTLLYRHEEKMTIEPYILFTYIHTCYFKAFLLIKCEWFISRILFIRIHIWKSSLLIAAL
jgi:hypothetical protein